MHDRKDLNNVWLHPIDNPIWKTGELALVDIACNLEVHLGATANSVEGIFENVEKPLLKTWLSFPVKPCRLASLQLSFRMPPDVHQACFFRNSAMTVSESTSLAFP